MRPKAYILIPPLLLLILGLGSCRKDFDFNPSPGNLIFSKDTVYLDTVFTNIGSSTYSLKVFNPDDEDIYIPSIRLENGESSGYRLNVDGEAGRNFENIPLLAKDSLFIFIEVTFDVSIQEQTNFLYTDALVFQGTTNTQQIPLVTLIKDAIFLYPERDSFGVTETLVLANGAQENELRLEGFFLDDQELEFTNEKPYVIYGYAAVPPNSTLNIEAGTRVHFHENSGLLVGNQARVTINGALSEDPELLENEVIFEGDRLEPEFNDVPGQWGTVWLAAGSENNSIAYLTLKNAKLGLFVEGGTDTDTDVINLTISNSQILNSSLHNLWSVSGMVEATNCVFGNAGDASVYGNLGGAYNFKHCTIANYWVNGFRSAPALQLDNFLALDNTMVLLEDLTQASFANCIIDGNRNREISLLGNPEAGFQISFVNCAIKYDTDDLDTGTTPLLNFNGNPSFVNPFLNRNIGFVQPTSGDFRLDDTSQILGLGDMDTATSVPLDILGNNRTERPDLGAYQFLLQE